MVTQNTKNVDQIQVLAAKILAPLLSVYRNNRLNPNTIYMLPLKLFRVHD